MARNRLSGRVDQALMAAAERYNVPIDWLRRISRIESGWNPSARRGSYEGLFQLSEAEFRRVGGSGDRSDPDANAMAGAALIASHRDAFRRRYRTEPTLNDMYLIHQQGWGGYQAHRDNPTGTAWENMLNTREGRERTAVNPAAARRWAQDAVWGNVPHGERRRFGNVGNVTSGDLVDIWNARITSTGSTGGTTRDIGGAGTVDIPRSNDTPPETGGGPGAARALTDFANLFNPPPDRDVSPPPTTTTSRGFADYNYPLVNALTGVDQSLGTQMLGSIFGQEGIATGKRLTRLADVGRRFAEEARRPPPSISLSMPELPEQEMSAFALPERRRRM